MSNWNNKYKNPTEKTVYLVAHNDGGLKHLSFSMLNLEEDDDGTLYFQYPGRSDISNKSAFISDYSNRKAIDDMFIDDWTIVSGKKIMDLINEKRELVRERNKRIEESIKTLIPKYIDPNYSDKYSTRIHKEYFRLIKDNYTQDLVEILDGIADEDHIRKAFYVLLAGFELNEQ